MTRREYVHVSCDKHKRSNEKFYLSRFAFITFYLETSLNSTINTIIPRGDEITRFQSQTPARRPPTEESYLNWFDRRRVADDGRAD